MLFMDCVNLSKVKFASNQEHEFITNWKILQKAFKAAGVDKVRVNVFLLLMLIIDFDMVFISSELWHPLDSL